MQIKTHFRQLLADTVTPVSLYLKLRDKFANSILLESSDYHGNENPFSYLCCDPVARFEIKDSNLHIQRPDGSEEKKVLLNKNLAVRELENFSECFSADESVKFPFIHNGLFGYMAYPAVQYFEEISLKNSHDIPDMLYQVFRYVIAINHFRNEMFVFEHQFLGETEEPEGLENIISLIENKSYPSYPFHLKNTEKSNLTDEQFRVLVDKGRQHCQLGDVFQVVLSRRFEQAFEGDEFNVYRALRSVNPSPYLFYFDFGNFKIFGSSPETQILIQKDKATIYPIAGTFRRTGNDAADAEAAQTLYDDPKENAEHVMLVDLARNDLSRHSHSVKVETFKEIQYYSHVIHLVSKVTGRMSVPGESLQLVADTFPAGTLSGSPKHRAMQLIDEYENTSRSFYGGCIGFMDFNGDFNHAIMIRSFLSRNHTLHYQAGAGIVSRSERELELQEVNNKIAALRKALQMAGKI
jgi:anthranilate synthase component I